MNPAKTCLSYDRGTLLLTAVGPGTLRDFSRSRPWRWDERVLALRCHAMHYAEVRARLRAALADDFADCVPRPVCVAFPRANLHPLRPEQKRAIEAWDGAGGRGVIVMPTGTGKTEVALAAMAKAQTATLVVLPVRDLMYQWHRRILQGLGIDAGVLGDAIHNVKPVTVTTYDSACIHMDKLGDRFGLIVFDEAHHLPGRCRREAALFCAAPLRLGLTATPERSDGLHADLDALIGPRVFTMEIDAARGRALADYNVVRIPVALSDLERSLYEEAGREVRAFIFEKRKEQRGYTWQDLCRESGKDPDARRVQKAYYLKKSIEDRAEEKLRVLEDIFRLHAGERVIVFAGSNAMAREVSLRFLVPTLLNHSRKRERLAVLEGFAEGRFPVLVANQVLDEGVDVPEAKVAVVIGGQTSTRQAKQRLGRILRRSGQARATLYEVVCEETGEVERSRRRRRSDAFRGARRWKGPSRTRGGGPC